MTLRMARDDAWLSFSATYNLESSFSSLNMVPTVIKNGTMAIKSTVFIMSLTKACLEGQAIRRMSSSRVNHTIQADSTMKNGLEMDGTSSSKTRVLLSEVKNTL